MRPGTVKRPRGCFATNIMDWRAKQDTAPLQNLGSSACVQSAITKRLFELPAPLWRSLTKQKAFGSLDKTHFAMAVKYDAALIDNS